MNAKRLVLISGVALCLAVLAGYSVFTTVRIKGLSQRLNSTEVRLRAVEASLHKMEAALKPHVELLGADEHSR